MAFIAQYGGSFNPVDGRVRQIDLFLPILLFLSDLIFLIGMAATYVFVSNSLK